MHQKGWSDLPPDLLREIAGHLHVGADFVIFHAVCSPWRSSRDVLPGTTTTTTQLLPWFLARTEKQGPLNLRCIFSESTYRVLPPPYRRRRSCVYSAEGGTVRYLTFKQLHPTLHDPFTGAATDLPRFPYYFHYPWEENPSGIVYSDGTTFLYGIGISGGRGNDRTVRFHAALLRPGDAGWTVVDRTFGRNDWRTELGAAYHRGRFLVSTKSTIWRVVTPDDDSVDVLVPRPCMAPDETGHFRWECTSYILESHGELLCVLVQVKLFYSHRSSSPGNKTFLVSVHALEEATMPEKVRWVELPAEHHCLADRVFLLGSPNSNAVDASLLGGGHGGCAYFVHNNSNIGTTKEYRLFRYSFVDGKTVCIERLPEEWRDDKCMWLVPQPTIAPIKQIIRRRLQAQKLKKQQKTPPVTSLSCIFQIERHYQHRFRVLVHNLRLDMKNSQLKLFFSKHGRVSSTEITYHRNTKTSEGIVKMANACP